MFTEVAEGTVAVSNRFVEGKAALVFGTGSVLAVDACNYRDEAEAMVAEAGRRGHDRVDRLLYTHGHGDHVLGSGAFPDAVVFSHTGTVDRLHTTVDQTAARTGRDRTEVAAELRWPQVRSGSRVELDLGGRRVLMLPAPGHTADSVCAYVVEDRVLIGGDTVVTGIVPAITDGDSATLEATLRGLLDLDAEVLVPGHGPVVHGAAQVRDWLTWEADYLRALRALVAAEAGLPEPDLLRAAPVEACLAGRLPVDRHQMPERHRRVIRKILAEHRG